MSINQAFITAGTSLINGTSYILTENVTMNNPFTFAGSGAGITVNGGGHTVTAVNNGAWAGLFSSAITVQNLGVLSDGSTLARLCGWFFGNSVGGVATNCYSTGNIEFQTGGIFGNNSNGTATNCYSTGSIGNQAGGIFGMEANGTATNCYSVGSIGAGAGGIFGFLSSGTATNCYSAGSIGGSGAGGIFGVNSSGSATNSGNSTGWNDTDATTYLTGYPGQNPRVWTSTASNTPYQLYTPPPNVPCFPAGTRILTASGYKAVETFTQGELVLTADGRQVPVKIYGKHLSETTTVTAPFRVPANSLGPSMPAHDLILSPDHAFQIRKGLWMLPKRAALLSDRVKQVAIGSPVTYFHFECPSYLRDNLVVNGVVVESYGGKTKCPYTYSESLKGYTRDATPVKFLTKA